MAVNYSAALKTTRMNAVVTAIDVDVPVAFIEICTAAFAAVLVVINLQDPSFTVSGDTMTMAGAPKSGVASNTGTAAAARIKSGGGTVVVNNLTVGTSGSDINLNSTSITSGQTVTLTAGTIQHAA